MASHGVETASRGFEDRIYTYQMSWIKATFLFVVACAAAVVTFHVASDNARGLVIDHLITLDPGNATIFWWVAFGLVALGALGMAAAMVAKVVAGPQQIILTADAISVPKSRWSQQPLAIRFADIEKVSLFTLKVNGGLGRSRMQLRINSQHRVVGILRDMMASDDEFEDLQRNLKIAMQSVRRPSRTSGRVSLTHA